MFIKLDVYKNVKLLQNEVIKVYEFKVAESLILNTKYIIEAIPCKHEKGYHCTKEPENKWFESPVSSDEKIEVLELVYLIGKSVRSIYVHIKHAKELLGETA